MDDKQAGIQSESDYSLDSIWKEYQNTILSIHPTDAEMSELMSDIEQPKGELGENPKKGEKGEVGETSKLQSEKSKETKGEEDEQSLKERLAKLEKEKEKLKRENEELKQRQSVNDLPFGMEPERFLRGENKDALAYLMKIIVPRIRRVISENRELFQVIYAIGKVSEPMVADTPKTCLTYNRGRNCREGRVHMDNSGNRRIHTCTLCWELLWIHVCHRVVDCPLMTRSFWTKIEAKKAP